MGYVYVVYSKIVIYVLTQTMSFIIISAYAQSWYIDWWMVNIFLFHFTLTHEKYEFANGIILSSHAYNME